MAAQGNKDAFDELYGQIVNRSTEIIYLELHKIPNLTGNLDDFSDYIDYLFFKIVGEYDSDRGAFSAYVDYVLNHRVAFKVQKDIIDGLSLYTSLDRSFDDLKSIELLADPNQKPIPQDIAIKNFRYKLASANKPLNVKQRMRNKILLLQFAGYTYDEICKELHITKGELRGHIKKIKEDDELINFNLEMK